MIRVGSLFGTVTDDRDEQCETIHSRPGIVIERIISRGHSTPWMEQGWDEWVMIVQGSARLGFQERELSLESGDFVLIPAGVRHRVVWTPPDMKTCWLAVHFRGEGVISESRFELWRQDDNGQRTCVDVFSAREQAVSRESMLSGSGHRQTYWVEEIVRMTAA